MLQGPVFQIEANGAVYDTRTERQTILPPRR
jgi:hypothetical protein